MANDVECYLGCPVCRTVLFRVERQLRNAEVFENVTVQLGSATDRQKCGTCGGQLARVAGPA